MPKQRSNPELYACTDFTERAFGRELLAALEVAPPTALPVVGARGHVRRSRAHPVFANSRGEITAYDAHGKLQWQVRRGCAQLYTSLSTRGFQAYLINAYNAAQ